jgi:hypothetical protein
VKEDALKEINHWVSEISVDGHGDVCYHNPTSAFHEVFPGHQRPSDHQSINKKFSTTTSRREENNPDMEMFKQSLLAYLPTQRRYESMAVDNLAAVQGRVQIPKEKAAEFLKLHWCWIHPMFMFVHRPAFTRKFPPSIKRLWYQFVYRRDGFGKTGLARDILLRDFAQGYVRPQFSFYC